MKYLYTNITTWSRTITKKDWPLIENFKDWKQTKEDNILIIHRINKTKNKIAQIEDTFDWYILTSVLDIYDIKW